MSEEKTIRCFDRNMLSLCDSMKLPFPVTFDGETVAEIVKVNEDTGEMTIKVLPGNGGDRLWALIKSEAISGMTATSRFGREPQLAWFVRNRSAEKKKGA